MRSLIDILDLSVEEIQDLLVRANDIIDNPENYSEVCKGKILATYIPDTLVWYTDSLGQGRNLQREIDSKYKGKMEYKYEETDGDVLIYFNEADIKKIASLVNPRTNGAGIKPFSSVNLPKSKFSIPEEKSAKFSDIYKDLAKEEKMRFAKDVLKAYDVVIEKKKGKTILDARKESGLTPKEYIYKLGLWNDFVKFAQDEYNSR